MEITPKKQNRRNYGRLPREVNQIRLYLRIILLSVVVLLHRKKIRLTMFKDHLQITIKTTTLTMMRSMTLTTMKLIVMTLTI